MTATATPLRIVVHLNGQGTVKGTMAFRSTAEETSHWTASRKLSLETASGPQEVDLSATKAVFFVKDFSGNPETADWRFFADSPSPDLLSVKLQFHDGENMEGWVANDSRLFCEEGFLLRPLHDESNNVLVFVLKHSLKDMRVVGVTSEEISMEMPAES